MAFTPISQDKAKATARAGRSASVSSAGGGALQGSAARGLKLVLLCNVTLVFLFLAGSWGDLTVEQSLYIATLGSLAVGLLGSHALVVMPAGRTRSSLEAMAMRLQRVGVEDRGTPLTDLRPPKGHELHEFGHTLHEAITRLHRERLEAKRVRREFDQQLNLQTRAATAELSKLAKTDALTGLGNRRQYEEDLCRLFNEAEASNAELAAIAIDMDHFKAVNDQCGHEVGDAALGALGEVLHAVFSSHARAYRFGGDEFFVLVPDASRDSTVEAGERAQKMFAQHSYGKDLPCRRPTLSMGVSFRVLHRATDPEMLERMADEALYMAKREGRMRVCRFDEVRDAA